MVKRVRRKQPIQKTAMFSVNGVIVKKQFTKKLGARFDKGAGYTFVLMKKNKNGKITLIEYHAEVPIIIDSPHVTKKDLDAIKKQIRTFKKEKDEANEEFSDMLMGKNDLPGGEQNKKEIEYKRMFA